MILITILGSLPHEARFAAFLGQADVVDATLLLVMNDGVKYKKGLVGSAGQSDSRHSVSATRGPRDMISLVTPSLGG
jgi:hypothetical protein